jgi:hypothetical protein
MNDEEVLQALAAEYQREDDARPHEWDDVAHGRRTVAEAIEARRAAGAPEADVQRAAALFAPLDDDFDARLAGDLVRRLAAPSEATDDSSSEAAGPQAPTPSANVLTPSPARWRRGAIVGAATAAAAALALWVGGRPPIEPGLDSGLDSGRGGGAELPGYALGVQPGAAAVRSAAATDQPELTIGHEFAVLLRPAARHQEPARAQICLRQETGTILLPSRQAPGAPGETLDVTVELPATVAPGPATIIAVVAAGPRPDDPCAAEDSPATRVSRADVQLVQLVQLVQPVR